MEYLTIGFFAAAAIISTIAIVVAVSGATETVRTMKVTDNVFCTIVSRGTNVSIDCWVKEKCDGQE